MYVYVWWPALNGERNVLSLKKNTEQNAFMTFLNPHALTSQLTKQNKNKIIALSFTDS